MQSNSSGCPIYPVSNLKYLSPKSTQIMQHQMTMTFQTYRYQIHEDDESSEKSARLSRGEKCHTRHQHPEKILKGFDNEISQIRAVSRERLYSCKSNHTNHDFGERLSTGSIIFCGNDHDIGSQDDCKQIDTDDATFRTDASSDLNSINKSFIDEKRNKKKNEMTQSVTTENNTEEILVSFRYGAEVAELLTLYCLHSFETISADKSQ